MSDPVTFTLDLEDHRPHDDAPFRVPALLDEILGLLDELAVVGTVFVVGELAERHPELVRQVAAAGHEVALHAWRHVPLTELTPDELHRETARGRALLADLSGQPVVGFRAPTFSLVDTSAWATEVLTDLGFTYSSSVLPAANPLYGWPGAPAQPFRWPSGLVELPVPVAGVGRAGLPYLGGVYFRLLPSPVARGLLAAGRPAVPWLYCHPYDFDPGEDFWVVPDAGRVGSRLLWLNRGRMKAKVERLLRDGAGAPLHVRAAGLPPELPVFVPGTRTRTPAVGEGGVRA
jgi:polysaccharide deacetylase family protein (PEP-CTERM system associated)